MYIKLNGKLWVVQAKTSDMSLLHVGSYTTLDAAKKCFNELKPNFTVRILEANVIEYSEKNRR